LAELVEGRNRAGFPIYAGRAPSGLHVTLIYDREVVDAFGTPRRVWWLVGQERPRRDHASVASSLANVE
jgi:hypothetical protein